MKSLFHIWFYVLVGLTVILLSPLLLLTSISYSTYPQFYFLARNAWARPVLWAMGLRPEVEWQQIMEPKKSYMVVSNHTSMIDILLMLFLNEEPLVFVGKKELEDIPIFGFFYKKVCIMVDRGSLSSRMAVYKKVRERLSHGYSICIFPEGGVPDKEIVLDEFKIGAFKMAIKHDLTMVPMTFLDCKKRFPWEFSGGGPGKLRVIVHPFWETGLLAQEDSRYLKNQIRDKILEPLMAQTS